MLVAIASISFDYGFEGFAVIHIKQHPDLIAHYEQFGAEEIRGDCMILNPWHHTVSFSYT